MQTATAEVVSTNPATGERLASYAAATAEQVNAAAESARAAQPAWAAKPAADRAACLRRFEQLLLARKHDVAQLLSREAGKPVGEALSTEILVALEGSAFCRRQAQRFLRPRPIAHQSPAMRGKRAWLERVPHGVVGIISPWNYPLSIPACDALAALAMGNAVLLKPSEFTTGIALELAALLYQAGVPEPVMQVLPGGAATGAALLAAPIDKLVFTGSVRVGKLVAVAAAERLLPVTLELGGKDPMLVLDDADVDVAASAAVWGAFMNAGQTCLSVERCFVQRGIYRQFVEACVAKTRRLQVGAGAAAASDVGPLIHPQQMAVVAEQVEDARSRGARVECGGGALGELGPSFYAPTILTAVATDMRVMQEETFGPVLPIMPFADDAEAVRLANASQFGLAASIWSSDDARARRLAAQLEAGSVLINDLISSFGAAEAPHGGVKHSGVGRTHGLLGLEEMTRARYVSADRLPRMKKLWWYPYGPEFATQMSHYMDMVFGGLGTRLRALPTVLRMSLRALRTRL